MRSPDSRLLAVTACLLWATAFMGVKAGLDVMPPFLFAGIRFTLCGFMVAFVYGRRKAATGGMLRQIADHWPLVAAIAFLQTFGLYSLFFVSLTMMRASTGAIVNGLGPLVVALTAHFLLPGNRLSRRQFLCLVIGVFGVVLVAVQGHSEQSSTGSEMKGIFMMFGALLSSAMASVLVSKSPDDLDPFVLNAAQLTLGGSGLLLVAFIRGDAPYAGMPGFSFWLALLWLILVTGGGFSIWYYLIKVRKEALSRMAVWKFLIPMGGAVFSWLFLSGDNPSFLSLGGVLLTALSIILFYREPRHIPHTAAEGESECRAL